MTATPTVFRIYLRPALAGLMTRQQMRGAWESAVISQGWSVAPGGVTVRVLPSGAATVVGRATRN